MGKDQKNRIAKANTILRYSGLAFQIATFIGIGVFIGRKLDAYFQFEDAYLTAACAIFFLVAGLFVSLKDVFKS